MRTLALLTLGLLTATLFLATSASAESVGVGNCQKSGACAGACVDITTPCSRGALVCFGISYEIPFCSPGLPPIA